MNKQLIQDHISLDLAAAFAQMSALVEQGVVSGAVFGLALKGPGRKYHVDVSGSLVRDPTYARGIVAALDDELRELVHGRSDSLTTR